MSKLPPQIQKMIAQLRKLPGVGAKTAERYAFRLIEWNVESLELLSQTITSLSKEIKHCPTCHCLKGDTLCEFCDTTKRDTQALCIVSYAKDIYPIEETRVFKGLYHVLGGVFSPLQGQNIEKIDVQKIKNRIESHNIKDVILALDSTLEGDATALFLKEEMKNWNLSISRLAFGIPLGSALDYVDPGTLTRALLGRLQF
ncbi:MAG: recombination mediator RecR [Chlamydiota bacterium]